MGLFVTLSEANICIDLVFSVVEQTSLIFGSPSIDMSTNNTSQISFQWQRNIILSWENYFVLGSAGRVNMIDGFGFQSHN